MENDDDDDDDYDDDDDHPAATAAADDDKDQGRVLQKLFGFFPILVPPFPNKDGI